MLTLKVTLGPCYDGVAEQLESRLQPFGAIEVLLAAQIVRAHWRLERCENAHDPDHPDIDRIRHRSEISIRRNMAEIRQLQADRHLQAELNLTVPGIARVKDIVKLTNSKIRTQNPLPPAAVAGVESKITALLSREAELRSSSLAPRKSSAPETNGPKTGSVGRNTPCPCRSGLKYKRCCGNGAAPLYGLAA